MGLLAFLLAKRPPAPTPEQEAERERSLRQVEAGGLPVAAERRLRELAGGGEGFFTSDLSVGSFALLHKEGIAPLTQVMGSSVFSHPRGSSVFTRYRKRSLGFGARSTAHAVEEVELLSDAYNGARVRALERLRLEAELAGADAVVGVRVTGTGLGAGSFGGEAGGSMSEFVALGTAVRLPPALRTGTPVITDLTAQEYWLLAQAGYRPVGVVGFSTVVYVTSSWDQNQVLTANRAWSSAAAANQELGEFTRGYRVARRRAMDEVEHQARAVGAHGIVGVTVAQDLEQHEWEDSGDRRRFDLVISLHLLGTAITEGHAPLGRTDPLTIIPLSPAPRPTRTDA
jgi:uncharacterized protein YbjQ (UPF0145 family)